MHCRAWLGRKAMLRGVQGSGNAVMAHMERDREGRRGRGTAVMAHREECIDWYKDVGMQLWAKGRV